MNPLIFSLLRGHVSPVAGSASEMSRGETKKLASEPSASISFLNDSTLCATADNRLKTCVTIPPHAARRRCQL